MTKGSLLKRYRSACVIATLALAALGVKVHAQSAAACGPGFYYEPIILLPLPPALPRPPLLQTFLDPVFGTCIERVTEGKGRNIYAQLQPWNANGDKVLMHRGQVFSSADYSLINRRSWGNTPRWSPVEPDILYSTEGNRLLRFDVVNNIQQEEIRFDEYRYLAKDASWEEMSRDGRYVALVGVRPGGAVEVFAYDVFDRRKSPVADALNALNPSGNPGAIPNWAKISPLGRYVLVQWNRGVAAYDINMNYLGVVNYGLGHSDVAVDADGVEWHLDMAAADGRSPFEIAGPVIRKSRLPDGLDRYLAGDQSAVQVLLNLGWGVGVHIACHGSAVTSSCIVSTNGKVKQGVLAREVFELYLDSVDCRGEDDGPCTPSEPSLRRLAHHRSDLSCSYWAMPFAAGNRDGSEVMFGSNWGTGCEREEAYVVRVPDAPALPPPVAQTVDIELVVGELDGGQYGKDFGSNQHLMTVTAAFRADASGDLTLRAVGYDIDSADEIAVYLNGDRVGFLSQGPTDALNGGDAITLPADKLVDGLNYVRFQQKTYGWAWGVTQIGISQGATASVGPVGGEALRLGEVNHGEFGFEYGSGFHHDRFVTSFDADASTDLLLSVTGYDVDKADEVTVYLNGELIGALRTGDNRNLNSGDVFVLPKNRLQAGNNELEFRQKTVGWAWGVTDLWVGAALPADIELEVGRVDAGRYGRGYGSDQHRNRLIANFTAAGNAPLTLTLAGHDIDSEQEVLVFLNNVEVGHLSVGPNDQLNDGDVITLPAAALNRGVNQLRIQQLTGGWAWGVTRIGLSR